MALDNVVPIDAEAARLLERRNVRFRWFVAALAALWISALVPVLVFSPLPPVGPFVVLAILVVLAEHRFVLFGDETSMSASIVVVVASVFVFVDSAPLAGPMLIASLGGLYFPHLVRRGAGKAAFNGMGMGLSAVAPSVIALTAAVRTDNPLFTAVIVAASTCAYWIVNNVIVASYQSVVNQQIFKATARQLLTSDTEILTWAGVAAFGAALATNAELSQFAFLIAIVALRIAVHDGAQIPATRSYRALDGIASARLVVWMAALSVLTFSGSTGPTAFTYALTVTLLVGWIPATESPLSAVALPIFTIAAFGSPALQVVVISIGLLIAVAAGLASTRTWTWCIVFGGTMYMTASAAGPLHGLGAGHTYLQVATAVALPSLFAAGLFAVGVARALNWRGAWVILGAVTPTSKEMATLAAVMVAGLASLAGLEFGLIIITAHFIARAAGNGLNDQRSPQTASR